MDKRFVCEGVGYSTNATEPQLERAPISSFWVATLSFVASASLVILAYPTEGSTSLYTSTLPKIAGLKSTIGLLRQTHVREVGLDVNVHEKNSDPSFPSLAAASETSLPTRKIAGFALGAVCATVLTLANRLRLKPATHSAPSSMQGTAVLDPPAINQAPSSSEWNKGIVTPEEGLNLPFTTAQLRDAIPKECFEKSLFWSMFYFARDWAIVGLLYYFQPTFFGLGIVGKLVWWNVVGFYGWCLFVVGHDCGHGTFSNYGWLNQLLGHVCHAPLLVPFNGWRISHRNHHQYHNDIDRDHSWVPSVAKNIEKLSGPMKWIRFTPLILLAYPYYLISNSHENGFSGCHFWPWNSLFKKEERMGIVCSALSVFAFLGVIAAATMKFGAWTVFQAYWIPYLIFVCWLDLVTMMQHTDKNCLFFRGEAWSYLRGAMSTVDRTYRHLIDPFNLGYGRIIDHLHHNISDGHVVHHIFFTQIPHYKLIAATQAIRPLLGKHYRFDDTPILKAFHNTMQECWYVDDIDSGVVTYKGKKEYDDLVRQQKQKALQGMA